MKPPSDPKKQTQTNPVLPALRSFSEGGSAVEWVEWANFTYPQRHALSRACSTLHLGRKISVFLIKSLPKIAENRVIMAFSVRKKAEKPLKAELKTQFGKEVKNVLELI